MNTMPREIPLTVSQTDLLLHALWTLFEAGRRPAEHPLMAASQQVTGAAAKMLRDALVSPGPCAVLGMAWTPDSRRPARPEAINGVLSVETSTMLLLLINAAAQALLAVTHVDRQAQARRHVNSFADVRLDPAEHADAVAAEVAVQKALSDDAFALLMDLQRVVS
jgi:hypothetical protein